jgi:hypothetical protein
VLSILSYRCGGATIDNKSNVSADLTKITSSFRQDVTFPSRLQLLWDFAMGFERPERHKNGVSDLPLIIRAKPNLEAQEPIQHRVVYLDFGQDRHLSIPGMRSTSAILLFRFTAKNS